MSACPQCGTVAKPTDKFCNVCGTPIPAGAPAGMPGAAPPAYGGQPAFGAPPQPAYGAPAPAPGFGAPPPGAAPSGPRCQMGHDIAPGASYCAQGHPIALDQMQFASDAYGGGGGQPAQFGAPPPQQQGYGAPAPASPYGAPPAPNAFGAPPQQAYGQQPPAQGYGAPAPSPGFGAPPPAAGYAPPAQPGFGAPAPAYGGAAPAAEHAPGKILRGFVVAYGANASGDFWPLQGGRVAVGRLAASDGIDISLQDPTISSRHAAFNVDAQSGGIAIEDTGSTNGTFVNDEHIGFNGRRELRDGDRVRFGGFTTIVKVIGRV